MSRQPRPDPVGPGQESVWDYPRPPALLTSGKLVEVRAGDVLVARSTRTWRVLETSHPPTWYLPREDVVPGVLQPSASGATMCEWKGAATYWDVEVPAGRLDAVAWSYEHPTARFAGLAGAVTFYPSRLDCTVDGEVVRPQQGGFYGGWITGDVVGPFKGTPGSWGW